MPTNGGSGWILLGRHRAPDVGGPAASERPAQGVEDLVVHGQAVAEEPVVAGGRPVVIDVRAHAVVVGATEVMALSIPSAADSVGARSRAGSQLLPTESVEDQQHDLAGPDGHGR